MLSPPHSGQVTQLTYGRSDDENGLLMSDHIPVGALLHIAVPVVNSEQRVRRLERASAAACAVLSEAAEATGATGAAGRSERARQLKGKRAGKAGKKRPRLLHRRHESEEESGRYVEGGSESERVRE